MSGESPAAAPGCTSATRVNLHHAVCGGACVNHRHETCANPRVFLRANQQARTASPVSNEAVRRAVSCRIVAEFPEARAGGWPNNKSRPEGKNGRFRNAGSSQIDEA